MTNISKRRLSTKQEEKLFAEFCQLFQVAQGDLSPIFEAVFTEAERVMFVKRVAIVLMLARGASTYAISKSLYVSDSTVREIKKQAKVGKYDALVSTFDKNEFNQEKFWRTVETLLRLGLPEQGRRRWQWLDEVK